jgi:hypothetical protein
VQAIGTTALDLPPVPSRHACVARDPEYVRQKTLSLLAGIDLLTLTGEVHASVEESRSREFVAFLRKLDAAYPPATAIKLVLENYSRVPAIGERPLGLGREQGVGERSSRQVPGDPFTATRSTAEGRFSPAELDSWRV